MKRKLTIRDEVCGYGGLLLLMLALWWLIGRMSDMTPHYNHSRFEEGVPQCETTHKQQNGVIVETTTCTTIRGIQK